LSAERKKRLETWLTTRTPATGRKLRSAIVGTGFIAEFHARGIEFAPDAELVAVSDSNLQRAEGFAAGRGARAYASLDEMLGNEAVDVVHILTPPDLHHSLSKKALLAGVDVFVEKPMCVSAEETADLLRTASETGRTIGVNHSALFSPAFSLLRKHISNGELGSLDYVNLTHLSELGVMRLGPFNNWIVRDPGNALLEIGSHLVSELIDLVGEPDEMAVSASRPIDIPGGGRAYRRWRIHGDVGRTAVDLTFDFSPGFPQRTIMARGLLGSALCDFNANTCVVDRRTTSGLDFDRRSRSLRQASEIRRQTRKTMADVLLSKAKLRRSGTPDQISIQDSIASFYDGIRNPAETDARVSAAMGHSVVRICQQIITQSGVDVCRSAPALPVSAPVSPTVLVLGGTGFIGKALIKTLLDEGYNVRAAARGPSTALQRLGDDRIQFVRADMSAPADLDRALEGIEYVFHLATTDSKTWPEFIKREVEPAQALADACLRQSIKRLVYTGTIDSFYAGPGAGRITESTPLDPKIGRRNTYARAKAAAEQVLLRAHRTMKLPVVVVRPGIVIGRGGNPFHWGVGRWTSEGIVELWGDGTNALPLVLVEDVASGLVRAMTTPGIEGRTYNLVDEPLLSACDYIRELERLSGFKVDVRPRPPWRYYLDDLVKWPVKVAVGHSDAQRIPSYKDWASRTQKALFDSSLTRQELGWRPASNRQDLIEQGIAGSLEGWLAARR
jgi:nucleoside-diphosphate-sugar epimerase/predicted dehydrogenase